MAADSKDNPDAACLPIGYMQSHTHSQPRKLIQFPDLIVILYEANGGCGRSFSIAGWRLRPTYNRGGREFARAVEGDTLIVESTNFRDGGWLE